jgi:DNA repair protein RecO (recombination protein O)
MNQVQTRGIVLARTDFGEADRILTVLTQDEGKVRLMAKGVRKVKSKLAGGIELFSISQISFIPGRREISTLTSTRLEKHFGDIVGDINRTMQGYDWLKLLNRATEDMPGPEYFEVLAHVLEGLNNLELDPALVQLWLYMQLLKLAGHTPNLISDEQGKKLEADKLYRFDLDDMYFVAEPDGPFEADHIKLLRLASGLGSPEGLVQLKDADKVLAKCIQLALNMSSRHMRV